MYNIVGTAETVHGSLLVVKEVLVHTGEFMVPRFKEISKAILEFKDHKSTVVRAAIAQLLPSLAEFCPDAFAHAHMNETVDFLQKGSKIPELRTQSLVSSGQLCLALGHHLADRVNDLIVIVKDALLPSIVIIIMPSSKGPTLLLSSGMPVTADLVNKEAVSEALQCIGRMVQGLGTRINDRVELLLEIMFLTGITPHLIDTLSIVVRYVPSKLDIIQEKLLLETMKVLGGDLKFMSLVPDHLYSWGRVGSRRRRDVGSKLLRGHMVFNSPSPPLLRPSQSSTSLFIQEQSMRRGGLSARQQQLDMVGVSALYSGRSPPLHLDPVTSRNPTPPLPTTASLISMGVQKGLSLIGLGSHARTRSTSDFNGGAAGSFPRANLNRDPIAIVLSLKTLGSLTLSSCNIIPLLMNSVLPFFESIDHTVRREAAVTCAHMVSLAMIKTSLVTRENEPYIPYGSGGFSRRTRAATIASPIPSNETRPTSGSYSETTPIAKRTSSVSSADHSSSFDINPKEVFSPKPKRIDSLITNSLFDESHLLSSSTPGLPVTATGSKTPRAKNSRSEISRPNTTDIPQSLTVPAPSYSKRAANRKTNIYTHGPTAMYIDTILTRLLQIIVSDPNQDVRQSALRCVITSPIFDSYISRKNHIDTLIFLLADDMFDIRIDALTVLGRLALINPALVLPPLRMALVRLISEISHSADSRQKEDSILIVCQFLNCTSLHQLVKAYVGSLIKVLPLQADIRLTTASLSCIGEICKVMRQDMIPYFDDLLPILVKNMQDQSSRRKQEVAISTLGLLVSATGKVVEPYLKYPQLLPKALDLLFKSSVNTPMTLRMETLRCIGLIGALEPQKYNLILQHLQSLTEKKGEIIEGYSKRVAPTTVIDVAVPHSFVSTTGAGGGGKEESRLRSDSLAQQDWNASAGGRRVKSGSEVESELIRSEVVLEDANFDQPACLFMYSQCVMRSVPAPSSQETLRRTPHNEDYYPRVAIAALVRILHERALSVHHSAVTQAIVTIFKSLGMKSVPFLDELVPFLLHIMRVGGPGLRESLLQQFSTLVSIVQYHISVYLPAVFEIIHDFWFEHLEQVLILVEDIAVAASNQFGSYFTEVLPLLLSSIVAPKNMTTKSLKVALQLSGQSAAALFKPLEQVLSCCNALRGSLLPHLHLVIPILCKLMAQLQEIGTDTVNWQILTVRTIRKICTVPRGYASISDQSDIVASRLVHCLTNTISWCYSPASTTNSTTIFYSTPTLHEPQVPINSAIYVECIHTLCSVGIQIGPKFITFDNLILRTLSNKGLNITEYLELSRLMSSGMLPEFDYGDREVYRSDSYEEADGLSGKIGLNSSKVETDMVGIGSYYVGGASARMQDGFGRLTTSEKFYMNSNTSTSTSAGLNMSVFSAKLPFNQQQLSRAWDVSQRSTSTDWLEWFRRLKVELIRESPNPALRACSALCQAYPPLANELFHASFVSCWYELSEQYQDSLVRALQRAFKSSTIPPECLQTLLNLAEFMEHDVEPLPISLSILAELAQKGHAYAKALHYRELEFQSSPATCFESLVTINKKLDQYDAAVGILTVVEKLKKKHPELQKDYTVHESWLAKLGYWNEALTKYEERLQSNPTDGEAMAGKLKCLDALGRWEEAISLCNESLDHLKRDIALISQIPATRDGREGRDTRDSSPKDISTSANRVGRDQESLTMRNRKTVADQQKRLFSKAAVIGARAAWSLNEWNLMESFVTQLPEENLDASFMRAVLAIHRENFTDSSRFIEQTRLHLDSTITALLAESYGRAYVPLIMVQQCSELEEIAEYKMLLREAGVEELDSQPSNNSLGRSSSRLSLDPQHLQQPISTRPPLSPSRPLRPGQLPPVPLSPRTKSALKLSDFTAEDSSSAMSNEQSMQFSLQLEAK